MLWVFFSFVLIFFLSEVPLRAFGQPPLEQEDEAFTFDDPELQRVASILFERIAPGSDIITWPALELYIKKITTERQLRRVRIDLEQLTGGKGGPASIEDIITLSEAETPEADKAKLRKRFAQLDTDNDGKIGEAELLSILYPDSAEAKTVQLDATEVMDTYDLDGDRKLSKKEYEAASESMGLTAEETEEQFNLIDTKKDGYIDDEELRNSIFLLYSQQEFGPPEHQVNQVLEGLGLISEDATEADIKKVKETTAGIPRKLFMEKRPEMVTGPLTDYLYNLRHPEEQNGIPSKLFDGVRASDDVNDITSPASGPKEEL